MRSTRNFLTLAGLSLVLLFLGATGARGQVLNPPHFVGSFTLPFNAQWGTMNLPAGDYTLRYGTLLAGATLVEIAGKAKSSPHGVVLTVGRDKTSSTATKSALICIRNGNGGIVSELQMAEIGESVTFHTPHGAKVRSKVIAEHQNNSGNTWLVQVAIPVEFTPAK